MNQIYQTQNLALAVSLLTMGVPLPKDDNGTEYCVINYYDKDVLRKITNGRGEPLYKGMTVEQAAERAWKDGKPGLVAFCFQRTELLEEVIHAFDAQKKLISNPVGDNPSLEITGDVEGFARFAAQLLHNRRKLRDSWKDPLPVVAYHGEQTATMEAGARVVTGSFRAMTIGAGQKVRQKLHL